MIGTLLIKLAIIRHRKSILRCESTAFLLRKFTRDFFFFSSCIIENALVTFLGVILIDNGPKRRILHVREKAV